MGETKENVTFEVKAPRVRGRSGLALLSSLVMSLCFTASSALAQSSSSSTIHGAVKDETGAALPGVTVTLSSPALQVGQVVQVSTGDGTYSFKDLPAGTYKLVFELTGFSPFVRDDLRITVGFIARVDATMAIGRVEEAVTVSGQSPVVDLTSTSTSATFTSEVLTSVPRGNDLWAVLNMTPGVTMSGAPDVGGSAMTARSSMQSFGVAGQPRLDIEGINVTTGPDENSAVYLNYDAFEEVQVKTSGNDAEVGPPGIRMISVLKSGSNDFHGRYAGNYEGSSMQGDNISAALRAQGLRNTEPLQYHYNVSGDLGGRLVRDKLWFYGNVSKQERVSQLLGFVLDAGPDGKYLTGDEPGADYYNTLNAYGIKGSWQLTKNNRLIGVYQKGTKIQPQNGAGRLRPLEATRNYNDPTWVWKGEIQSTLTSRTLLNVVSGYGGYFADYQAAKGCCAGADKPSRLDRETGLRTGSHEASDQRPRDRWMVEGSVSFFPEEFLGGKHELKTGTYLSWQHHATGLLEHPWGNYVLVADRVNGVSGTPVEMQIFNYPVVPDNRQYTYAAYLKDTWRVSEHVTANLGVRWERQESLLADQEYPGSTQFPTLYPGPIKFDKKSILVWNRVVPRAGIAWDLNGKTVVKGTFGLYAYTLGDDFAAQYNTNALSTATYRWRDLNGDKRYQPGEVDLNLNGPDFINITGASTNIVNPNLRQPKTMEISTSLERELAENLGVRAVYVYRKLTDYFTTPGVNVLRPFDVYSNAITRTDPGADGVVGTADDGGPVTFYDYQNAYRGAAFVGRKVQNSSNNDWFHSFEVGLTKRFSQKWLASASFFAVKNHRWINRNIESPNDLFFPVDETWSWASNVTGSYRLPYGIMFSGFVQIKNGVQGQRTYVFRSVPNLSTVNLRLEPYGTQKGNTVNISNLRATKEFRLGKQKFGVDLDIFNVFNTNAPNAITFASGPTFGYVTDITNARVLRVGGSFSF